MFTRCPACRTLFRVRADILRIAQGQVRCGRCGAQFNALESLAEDPESLLPSEPAVTEAIDQVAESAGPMRAEAVSAPQMPAQTAASETAGVAQEPETSVASESAAPVTAGLAPKLIQEALLIDEPPRPGRGGRALSGLAILLLSVLLGAQWVYMQRVPLYERAELRPALQRFCALLACDLPLSHAPDRIEVVERLVREHPRVAGALLVDITFINRAPERLAYPVLELRLSDVSGNRTAGRRFAPEEYLPSSVSIAKGLIPDRPVQVSLELVAPQTDVVSFQFEFL